MAKKAPEVKELEEKIRKLKIQHELNMIMINHEMSEKSRMGDMNRARSFQVGTAFGGITEISMRAGDGVTYWAQLQPVEVVEIIQQLAANIGCHVAIKPREDFSTWREWKVEDELKLAYNGWAPWVNDISPHLHIGTGMAPMDNSPGRVNNEAGRQIGKNTHQEIITVRSDDNADPPMAVEKNINQRKSKRTTDTPR